MRLKPHSADGNSANRGRQLDGSNGSLALSDRNRDGFTRIPFLAEVSDLPLGGRHHAVGLMRQIHAGFVAESCHLGILSDPVDAEPVADVVEKHIAGLRDSPMQFDLAVCRVAMEIAPVERFPTATMHTEAAVDDACF